MDWMQTTLAPDFYGVFWAVVRTPADRQDRTAIKDLTERLTSHYALLDRRLATRPYLVGDRFSLADIAVGVTLYRYFEMEIDRRRFRPCRAGTRGCGSAGLSRSRHDLVRGAARLATAAPSASSLNSIEWVNMRHDRPLRNLGLFLVLSVACVSAGSPVGAADDSLRVALESRYADLKAAIAARDAAALSAIFAPDFVSVDVSGQSKVASQVIADLNAVKPDPNKTSETTLISITPAADSLTVEQRYDMKTVKTAAMARSTIWNSSPVDRLLDQAGGCLADPANGHE